MNPEDAKSHADWPDHPDQWPDNEPLDIAFEQAEARMGRAGGRVPFLGRADDTLTTHDGELGEAHFKLDEAVTPDLQGPTKRAH